MQVNVEQALKRAKKHAKKGELAQAEESYLAVLESFPQNKRAQDGLAELREMSLVEAPPPPERVQELIGLFTQGRLQEVLERGNGLIEAFPRTAVLYNIVGAANVGLKRLDEALQNYRKALEINPTYAEAHNNMANAQKDKGDIDAAIASYREAIRLKPDYAEAYNNMGTALLAKGDMKAALESYGEAIRLKPDYAGAYNNLGAAQQARGDLAAAIRNFQQALKINPDYVDALGNMSAALKDQGKLDAALAGYRKVVKLRPDMAAAHNGLGAVLKAQGDLQGAIEHYKTAIRISPDYAGGYNNMGNALQAQGDFEGAIGNFEHALKLSPGHVGVHRNLSLIKKYKAGDPQIEQMKKLAEQDRLSMQDKIQLGFALGKACGDTGETAEAFKWLALGNALRKKELKYDIATDRALFAQIKESFSQPPAQLETAEPAKHRPVFIVGMPRSGTSLAEQILASHSGVYGAGELPLLYASLRKAGWPTPLFGADHLGRLRAEYLTGLAAFGVSEASVTDKMPLNFRWVGHVLCAFPEAVVIHTMRDARATCWSVYKHYFSSRGNGYAYDIDDIVAYYKMYVDLMAFWRENFPGRIYDLSYEALTQEQEEETRKLLAHAGLTWEDACLEFHKTERAVLTTSSPQVRQKMYRGSSEEWRKYEEFLGPMMEGLAGL